MIKHIFILIILQLLTQGCAVGPTSPKWQYWLTGVCPGLRAEDPQYCLNEKWGKPK